MSLKLNIPTICLMSCVSLYSVINACGSSSSTDTAATGNTTGKGKTVNVQGPAVTVTVPVTVYVTATPSTTNEVTQPVAKVWVASNLFRNLSGYDANGQLIKSIDLTSSTTGSITSIKFFDKDNLFFFADPGATGELIGKVNVETGTVNPGYITDATFVNSAVKHMTLFGNSSLFVSRQAGGIERIYIDLPNSIASRYTGSWPLANTTNCPGTVYEVSVPYTFSGQQGVAMFSSGANTRINFWTNLESVPTCGTTTTSNYGAAPYFPGAAGYTPVGAFFNGTHWFVRYHHATTPRIVRYNFNGNDLSAGIDIVSNTGLLSTNASSRELIQLDDDTMLVPEWTSNTIHKFSLSGTYKGIFARSTFTTSVNSVTVRP